MLDEVVLKSQVLRKLVKVSRALSDRPYDDGPILAASRPSKEVPEEPAQFRVVGHSITTFQAEPVKRFPITVKRIGAWETFVWNPS